MKHRFLFLFVLLTSLLQAQISYQKQNIDLISLIQPNFGVSGADGRFYSGCWGWFQPGKNKEYAISGASNGTYFIDVTNPATPTVCAYVPGKLGCTWREVKTYQHYCYIASDDPKPNKFQIVDMQYLPDSVHIVHEGTSIFEHAHTLWIDGDHMYVGLVTYTNGYSPMNVYSLANPAYPTLLRELQQDLPIITEVHDMYSRHDTVYASAGWAGLYVVKYDASANKFTQLGSYSGYAGSAYNHSSSLTRNGKYLVFCDEVPTTKPINLVNVENFSNIQPVQTFKPYSLTTPHNPYVIGNDFAVVSCYEDGLFIYDISQPGNVAVSGYFDTHPQSGANMNDYFNDDYSGNWGAYPYLPSGIIIAQDMQNGVFLLDATKAYNNRVGIAENAADPYNIIVFPNPASKFLNVYAKNNTAVQLQIKNMLGEVVFEKQIATQHLNEQIDVQQLAAGAYFVSVSGNGQSSHKKIIVNH